VFVVASGAAAPDLELVEGALDDVAAAAGVFVVADRAATG
jgi:hypothetical protein